MIMLGIDAHKHSHTVVAVDDLGRRLGATTTTATTSADHLELIRWADQLGAKRTWAVEDCRHLSRQLERDMLAAGERLVRVPPKLMAHSRDAARPCGKSDPIDALAVARAALREPGLPTAQLDQPARELRLLVDHREDLVAERTRHINRLRWHLHDIDPGWDPKKRALTTMKHLRRWSSVRISRMRWRCTIMPVMPTMSAFSQRSKSIASVFSSMIVIRLWDGVSAARSGSERASSNGQ